MINKMIPEDKNMKEFKPIIENIKPIGRGMQKDNALWMCYSATGAAFQFTGKSLSVVLCGQKRRCVDDCGGLGDATL